MKILFLVSLLLSTVASQAGDLSKLILPGKTFGDDWELAQPNLLGNSAAPSYINRKLPHQPVVMVNIIEFKTPEAARTQWDKKFDGPGAATRFKKVEGIDDAYDNIPPPEMEDYPHMKRFMLFGHFWLTVEQVGNKDERGIFIEKYSEIIEKRSR